MNIAKIMEILPDTVKMDIIDFSDVKMKTGKTGTRILLDRILTDNEKSLMNNKHIIGLDCIATHQYAPEIKKSYFYIVWKGVNKYGIY